jgi:glycosyltransferase involved in cell wall biosynthesis
MKKRLAIILSHPIQYHSPMFKLLNERGIIDIKVFYTWGEAAMGENFDQGFGRNVQWDIPLLEGYPYELIKNYSKKPNSHHFNGIVNRDIIAGVKRYHPDMILIFGWAFNSHLKVIRYFSGKVPILFRGDSTLMNEQGFAKRIARYVFLRWVYKHIDKALYVGKHNYDYYIRFGMKPDQLVWAPHAIDNDRFMQAGLQNNDANRFRQSLGINEEHFVFLFAGKLEPTKDPVLLLQAFLALKFDPAVHLVFSGNGKLEEQLKSLAQGSQNIHFVEFQNQRAMPELYRSGDVFVLPSIGETWGLAVNEAMACKRPVLISDKCGCYPDLVDNAVNGYIFKAGDIEDLKQKMVLLYSNKDKLKLMQEASLKKVREYSIEAICAAIENTICSA